jgi:hypothetical protein
VLDRLAEMLEARVEEFAELCDGRDEVERAIDRIVWYAGWADKLPQVLGGSNPVAGPYFNFTVPEPTGVVAVLAPDEPPLLGLVTRLLPPLVGGNAVVAVASETRPLAAIELAEALATSDVPGGVVNLLTGYHAELGPVLASHMDVNAIDLGGAEDADAARAAEAQRAEALVVDGDPERLREATRLPILWRANAAVDRAAEIADAVTVTLPDEDEDHEPAQRRHEDALAVGLDCAVQVGTEEELERALEVLDPEIFLLAPPPGAPQERIEAVLDLLAEVPAGKLAIADLAVTTEEEVHELERAGVDAVIVRAADVSPLAGDAPPEV